MINRPFEEITYCAKYITSYQDRIKMQITLRKTSRMNKISDSVKMNDETFLRNTLGRIFVKFVRPSRKDSTQRRSLEKCIALKILHFCVSLYKKRKP